MSTPKSTQVKQFTPKNTPVNVNLCISPKTKRENCLICLKDTNINTRYNLFDFNKVKKPVCSTIEKVLDIELHQDQNTHIVCRSCLKKAETALRKTNELKERFHTNSIKINVKYSKTKRLLTSESESYKEGKKDQTPTLSSSKTPLLVDADLKPLSTTPKKCPVHSQPYQPPWPLDTKVKSIVMKSPSLSPCKRSLIPVSSPYSREPMQIGKITLLQKPARPSTLVVMHTGSPSKLPRPQKRMASVGVQTGEQELDLSKSNRCVRTFYKFIIQLRYLKN